MDWSLKSATLLFDIVKWFWNFTYKIQSWCKLVVRTLTPFCLNQQRTFMAQQPFLAGNASAISCHRTISADDAVAGHDD